MHMALWDYPECTPWSSCWQSQTRGTPRKTSSASLTSVEAIHLIAKPAVIIDIGPTEVLLQFQSPSSPPLYFTDSPTMPVTWPAEK